MCFFSPIFKYFNHNFLWVSHQSL